MAAETAVLGFDNCAWPPIPNPHALSTNPNYVMSDSARTLPPDIEIARRSKMLPIDEIAAKLGIGDDDLEHYGKHKAKVSLDLYRRLETSRPASWCW